MEQRNSPSLMWVYPALLVLAAALLGWGIYRAATHYEPEMLAAGCICVLAVLAAWVSTHEITTSRMETAAQLDERIAAIDAKLQTTTAVLNQISEQQLISERAKAIAFRQSERDALRGAIAEETARKDWDAALILASEMETVFGYKQEADRIREEIHTQREASVRAQVSEGMALIDKHCRGEQWTLALREAERLMAAFSNNALTQRLTEDVEVRRQNLKRQLLDAWNDSVARHDVDGAIEILKQLDMYLTPAEVEALQDTARQIFKDKLMQLGQQFGLAVKSHAWTDAIRLGEAIMNEFPNSRMAQEVREKMALLRERAASPETARAV